MSQKLGFSRISRMEESSVLTEFVDRMIRITDELVDQIKTGQLDGEFHFHQDSAQASAAGEPVSLDLLCEMLYERPEIAGVELCDDEVYVTVAPDYAVYENNTNYHILNQEQVDVICALHTLWLHGVGGEQADFSDCLLKGINLSSRNLNRAVFAGAKLVDCLMYDAKLNTSIFDGAKIQNCQLINAQAEHCSFRNAFIVMTDMDATSTKHSNFTGATISQYSVPKDEPFSLAEDSQGMGFSMREGQTMAYSKVSIPTEVYHFTQKQNLEQILSDRRIRRFGDTECWFCRSPEDMLRYMEMTVMNEGQKYIAPDRTVKRYPKFEPENYVMLRIVPAKWEDKWYQWNQELPANASPESRQQAKEFSELKLGYRGDLRFSQVEVFEMTEVMGIAPTQEQDTTFPNLAM